MANKNRSGTKVKILPLKRKLIVDSQVHCWGKKYSALGGWGI
jgi:hypothetical protein